MYNINSVVGVIVVKNDQLKHVSLEDINNQFFFFLIMKKPAANHIGTLGKPNSCKWLVGISPIK